MHYTQQNLMTCAPASIRILLKKLGIQNIPTEDSIRNIGRGGTTHIGMSPAQVAYTLSKISTQYHIHISRHTYTETDQLISHLQQDENNHALVLYMVDRNKNPHNIGKDLGKDMYGLHRAVATAYDDTTQEITLINPFGYIETFGLGERYTRWSLENQYLDWKERLLKGLCIIRPRTAFLISK